MIQLDHVVVVVDDLDEASRRWWEGTGLRFTPAGDHPGGTSNALAVSRDHDFYIELIVVRQASGDAWTKMATTRRGPIAWALSVADLDQVTAAVRSCGIRVSPVLAGSRTCLDGEVVSWRSAYLGEVPGESGWPFLIEWPKVGSARLGVEPTGSYGLTGLTVAVTDVSRAMSVLRDVLGLQQLGESCVTDGLRRLELVSAEPNVGPVALDLDGLEAETMINGLAVRPSTYPVNRRPAPALAETGSE